MLLFRDEGHVDRWCSVRDLPRGGLLTPDQAWDLANAWYKDKAQPDWRRYTLEETESLLARIGLGGSFWNLRSE